jgi:hypothetical protein
MQTKSMKNLTSLTIAFAVAATSLTVLARASDPPNADWPMWGGTADRNMLSTMKGLPTTWDVKTKKNVKWVAELGSQAYGNPTVAGGYVYVGTNNESARDPEIKGDKGILMAFRESDGQFMWQAVHDKLTAGRANDWPYQGICSSAAGRERHRLLRVEPRRVDGGRRRRLPRQDQRRPRQGREADRETDADIIWRFDMMDELGVMQHNMANSSPVMFENLIYISTSNGQDESHVNVPSPRRRRSSPSTRSPASWRGRTTRSARRSCTASGRRRRRQIGDTVQVVIGQGDGFVRSYEAKTGKKLWEFDLNPKEAVWPKTRNEVISTPVISENVVYIANGQDPEHGEGVGHPLRHRRHQARRHHQDRPDLALRRHPPLDLHRRDLQRHPFLFRLQRLPARARRQDRQAVLEARHVRGDLGIADGHRRQGLSSVTRMATSR